MTALLGADLSDFSVGIAVIVGGAVALAAGRFLARRAAKVAVTEFSNAVTSIVTNVVDPQLADLRQQHVALREQNVKIQGSLDEAKAQNARDHIAEIVEPHLSELRLQNVQLQKSIDEVRVQNARDHAAVALRLEAVEKRLPPPPAGYLPPIPQEHT